MAEILLYGGIDSDKACEFIEKINEITSANPEEQIEVRLNSPGGSVEYSWGAIAKFAELKGKKMVKVDGKAHSMGLYFCAYADNVVGLDVSEYCLHRAAYPSWFERDPELFTDAMKENLKRVNDNLKKAFSNKCDVAKFEEIKGVKLKDIFSMDTRIDCFLSAKEAKQIGLIDSIVNITPQKKAEIAALMEGKEYAPITANNIENKNQNTKMTLAELKQNHPALYAEAVAAGVKIEKERNEAWAHFADVDSAKVKAGIKSGEVITQAEIIELTEKKAAIKEKTTIEGESHENVVTAGSPSEAEKKAKEEAKKAADFATALDAHLNLTPKK